MIGVAERVARKHTHAHIKKKLMMTTTLSTAHAVMIVLKNVVMTFKGA